MAYMPLITPSYETPYQTNQLVATASNQPTGNEQQASSSIYSFSNYETPYQTNQHVATASNQPTGNEQQASAIVTGSRKRTFSDTYSLRILGTELTTDDPTFKRCIDTFFQLMPQADVKRMDQAKNNHGTKSSGKRITVLEHVKEVFLGQFGGFGLSTDVLGASKEQQKICRAALRIAAFLHDIGKIEGKKNHFATHKADTIRIATKKLTNEYAAYGLDSATACLAIALIRHRNFIGDFTHPNPKKTRSLEAIQTELQQAYQGLPNTAVTFEMFCQMLLKLYVANASTFSKVQKVGGIYEQFVIDNQEFKFHLLVVLKENLRKALSTQQPPQQLVTQTQTQPPQQLVTQTQTQPPQQLVTRTQTQPPQQQTTQRQIQQNQAAQFQTHPIQVPRPRLTPQQQAILSFKMTRGDRPKNLEETQEKASRAKKKQKTENG